MLVTVTVCAAEVVPLLWLPNARAFVDSETAGGATVAVPVTLITCGEPAALWAMLTVAVFAPVVVGEKSTPMVQLPPGDTGARQLFVTVNWLALVPPSVTPLTARTPVPVSEIVITWLVVVPTAWLPNASVVVGLNAATGIGGASTGPMPADVTDSAV